MDSLLAAFNGHFMSVRKWTFLIGEISGFIKKVQGCQQWNDFLIRLELDSGRWTSVFLETRLSMDVAIMWSLPQTILWKNKRNHDYYIFL